MTAHGSTAWDIPKVSMRALKNAGGSSTPKPWKFRSRSYDPEYYTAPYIGAKKTLKKLPDASTTYFGWKGLMAGITEGICAPMNETKYHDEFHQNEN